MMWENSTVRHRALPSRAVAALAVAAFFATACGSTVRQTGPLDAIAAPGASGQGMTVDTPTGAPGSPAATAPGSVATSAPTVVGPGPTAGDPATAVPGGDAQTSTPQAPGTPNTDGTTPPPTNGEGSPPPAGGGSTAPIKVGFAYLEGATNVMNGLGTEVSFGDGQLQAQALVDHVNATGGVNGRPLEAHFAGVDVASADPEAEYNAACTALTEDAGVFAVMTPINPPESFVACVAQHDTILLNASFNPGDDGLYAAFGDWFFSPSLLSLDRGAHLMLDALEAGGDFQDPLLKVGVLWVDADPPNGRVVSRVIVPRLESLGVDYELAAVNEVPQVSAAQLRFAAVGVNLVLFVAPNGISQLLFMRAAENQRYRPRYFTTDSDSTRFVSESAPEAQARNIRGVGTLPVANVPVRSHPTTPREQQCLDIIREAGENNDDRLTNVTATPYCELVFSFAATAGNAPGPLTHDSFRAGYRSLGTTYVPVTTFQIDFSSGRNDNTTLYRPYAWDESCRCMAYTGPATPIPTR